MPYGGINKTDEDYAFLLDHTFRDDFEYLALQETGSEGRWNTIDGDAGASVAADVDGVNGVVLLTTGATDNNECYIYSNETLLAESGKVIEVTARLQYAEANTDDANVMFGIMDGVAANALLDDGAGPDASFYGALWYKLDGETAWRVMSSAATAQTSVLTTKTAGQAGYQTLRIVYDPYSATEAKVTFAIDQLGLTHFEDARDSTYSGFVDQTVQHTVLTSATEEMAVVVGAKAGGANSEVISLDLIQVRKRR